MRLDFDKFNRIFFYENDKIFLHRQKLKITVRLIE